MLPAFFSIVIVASSTPSPDFNNFTYHVHACSSQAGDVTVRNGEARGVDLEGHFDLYVNWVKFGSMKAGTRQALVEQNCSPPHGNHSELFVYDVTGSPPKLLGTLATNDYYGEGSGTGVEWVRTRFAKGYLYVDVCDLDSSGHGDCKTSTVTTYALRGGKLVTVNVLRHHATPKSRRAS